MGYLSGIAEVLGDKQSTPVEVLIVEDEEMVGTMFESWLSNAGHSVRFATGGEEALRTIDSDVDVVLLDRRMPLITGDEILDLLRSEDIDKLDPEQFEARDVDKIAKEYGRKYVDDIELETEEAQ